MIIKKGMPATAEATAYVTGNEVQNDYITLSHDVYMNLVREAAMVHVAKNLIKNTESVYDTGTLMRIVFGFPVEDEE